MSTSINIILEAEQLEGTQALVSNWLVKPGDTIYQDTPIVELETDKVAIEIVAPATGRLQSIQCQIGDKALAGSVLALMSPDTAPANDSMESAPDKVQSSFLAPLATQSEGHKSSSKRHLLGPAVKKLLSQYAIDPLKVMATGEGGRITKKDVLSHLENEGLASYSQTAITSTQTVEGLMNMQPAASYENTQSTDGSASTEQDTRNNQKIPSYVVPHSTMRKTIANHMVESLLKKSPHVTSIFEMDMSAIIEHRKLRKLGYSDAEVNLTFTAYFLAASAKAIEVVPQINSLYRDDGLEIFNDINIGVGTALEDEGIIVPVIPKVQHKSLFELAHHLTQQTEKARNKKLTPSETQGGTFTISNYGVGGSLLATPIVINQPQVAILGVGKLEKRVVVETVNGVDSMVIKPMCYVSLSIDHRALDAYQTNKFLTKFVETIENWT